MELPILKYLPLPEDARRIVLQFLRKHHPTTALIKEIHFENIRDVFEDGTVYASLMVTGDAVRLGGPQMSSAEMAITFPFPVGGWALDFHYDRDGETRETEALYNQRMAIYANMLRQERGLHALRTPIFGPRN